MHIGLGALNTMDETKNVIYTDVHFHAEVSLIAFLRLVHFRITSVFVLGQAWGFNDRSIHDGAFLQKLSLAFPGSD
ncbi:hypothetical protein [Pseudoalteromonas sp. MEBiC 03607]|uniref:hypothetical protein n=1 Tax=Pseudoalteromonas sp. MEBiC 03607 TaxID=2563601 RepID=UPI00143F7339|nr:hypothetical protein [Pseudoalteromonas sp. MEBiC 03607]